MRNADPGWYDDGSGRQRWWDGARWTAHVADLSGPTVELREDSTSDSTRTTPRRGWYDDGHGRFRWWTGREWSARTKPIGEHRSFAGITVSGGWIHYGAASQRVGGVVARYRSSGEIAIDGVEANWSVPVAPQDEELARQFVTWVNGVSRGSDWLPQ
ncbi:MAG TPA: DUF2510 domain-containing protein [Microbacterium sp.]|nr:DUF2510 domain-containing protein [Microbacterium sp.]